MIVGLNARTRGRQNSTHQPTKGNTNQFDEEGLLLFCQNTEGMLWLTKELPSAPAWVAGITGTEKAVQREMRRKVSQSSAPLLLPAMPEKNEKGRL